MTAAASRVTMAWLLTGGAGVTSVRRRVTKLFARWALWLVDDKLAVAAGSPLAMALPDQSVASRRRRDAHAVAFQDLFVPHLDAAYNLARFLSRDTDAAQDIVQDAYLRAFRAFDGYRGGEPRAWILAIVRNCYRAWAGKRRHERDNFAENTSQDDLGWASGAVILDEIADADDETPEGALARQSEVAAVRHVIEGLPEPFREVLILRELEELSYHQIAEVIETPIGTVMSRLARARRLFGAAWLSHTDDAKVTK